MNKILNFDSVESAVFKISCGRKEGSTFLIYSDSEQSILFTSDHTLSEASTAPIQLILPSGQFLEASLLQRVQAKDIALVTIQPPMDLTPLPISAMTVAIGSNWNTFGFPTERIASGTRVNGTVSRSNQGTKWDLDLECEQYNNFQDFQGISGSPLIIDGAVAGVIGFDIAGGLGATGVSGLVELLNEYRIPIIQQPIGKLPASIEKELPDPDTTNSAVLDQVIQTLSNRPDSIYFLMSGNPGSGKTTLAAQLQFGQGHQVVCDRYFVKVPESEDIPTQIRSTPEYFRRWIEEVYSRILFNKPPDRPKEDEKALDRFLKIKQGMEMLGQYYKNQHKTGFLIIDGLDDVDPALIGDFLSVLPVPLSPGLKVVFSCTTKKILPVVFQTGIAREDEISVTPLSHEKATRYLQEQLGSIGIPQSKLAELANKSEGHPLYLRYLAKYVLGVKDINGLEDWIETIPAIHGEIERYYTKIWQQVETAKDEIWMAGTLSRLRIPVSEEELYPMLPASTRESFPIAIQTIRHLLKEDPKLSIYHTSFSDFIRNKTKAISSSVHDHIAEYCLKTRETQLSICEMIYHLANGSDTSKALEACNQVWVDQCALLSLSPDLVLSDIRRVIAHKVIELLLLSQRVNFRYNILFNENATYLVNALLALGKYEEALSYVVRNNALVVADGDAIYLLQRFFEYDADTQAEKLLTAIKSTCTAVYEKGLDSASFSRYINLRFSAITLSSNLGFENAYTEHKHLERIIIEMLKKSGNSDEVIHKFKDDIGSFNMGYFIWRFDQPPFTKLVEEKIPHIYNAKSSGFISLCIYQALNFESISPIEVSDENLLAWVEDLEYLIDKYGTDPAYHTYTLYCLVRFSKRVDLVQKIFEDHFKKVPEGNFRKNNGVDFDRKVIDEFSLYAECCGYLDLKAPFPKTNFHHYHNWEEEVLSRFELICFLSGRCRRIIQDTENGSLELPIAVMQRLLSSTVPSLHQRIDWDRSYGIPEMIFPVLYDKITDVLIDFFPQLIEAFLREIKEKTKYQLGLYTEGYMDSLLNILRRLVRLPDNNEYAFQVAKVLEAHVLATVENRWERNEYLLRLVQYYAKIENLDKANYLFKEMINYSMGPSWYKEAQLGIANTAVSRILPGEKDQSYIQKIAAHLDHASGEMTFQRYVKQQQESLVGDLARAGLIDEAIAYFKYLVLPDYSTIIHNAESGLMDMPFAGAGYILGARAIEEQSGILELLSGLSLDSSLAAFVMAELFMLGDDRYLSGFIGIQAKIINMANPADTSLQDALIERIVRFYITELDKQYRNDYLIAFAGKLSPSSLLKVSSAFHKAGIVSELLDRSAKQEKETKGTNDVLDALPAIQKLAEGKLRSENKSAARKLIVEGLRKVQQKRYSIWSSNYASEINGLRNLLAESYHTPEELIRDLHDLILDEVYHEEWVIANNLINILRNISDQHEKKAILDAVEQHIFQMVRTPQAVIEKYAFLDQNHASDEDSEYKLLNLLIWFLAHPSLRLKNRTMEALTWLAKYQTGQVLEGLTKEILRDELSLSKELAAAVIHQIAAARPEQFCSAFAPLLEKHGGELLKVKHFMIQSAILEAIIYVEGATAQELSNWRQRIEALFQGSTTTGGDIDFDGEHFEHLQYELSALASIGVLNRAFALELESGVERAITVPVNEAIRADRYINRSFNNYNEIPLVSDLHSRMRYALNGAILQNVSLADREQVASVLRFYQPTFPENLLQTSYTIKKGPEEWVKVLFSENPDGWVEIFNEQEVLLSYFSQSYSPGKRTYNELQIIAYLIPTEQFPLDDNLPLATFNSNHYPIMDPQEVDEHIVQLALPSEQSNYFPGSDLIPAVANRDFFVGLNLSPENDPIVNYWRNGRNWELKRQGAVQKSGYSVSIPGDFLALVNKKYKLIYEIDYEYRTVLIDVLERKILL
jgi:hypothetical protein